MIDMKAFVFFSLLVFIVLAAPNIFAAEQTATSVTYGDGSQWRDVGGRWSEENGVILPPSTRNLHSRTFFIDKAYGDATIEFEYWGGYREAATGTAGLILRASDAENFYWIHFPWCGQPYRAKHFWAGLGKVSSDSYVRHVKFEIAPHVPAEWENWYSVKVQAEGQRIRVWVDGRLVLDAMDDTHKSGFIGFAGYGEYQIRNLRITGAPLPPPKWNEQATIHKPMVELPVPSTWPTGCVAPNGDVLIGSGQVLLRSTDKGRTWSKEQLPEDVLPMSDSGSTLLRTADGKLIAVGAIGGSLTQSPSKAHGFHMSESTDNGHTWSSAEFCPLKDDLPWPAGLNKERLYLNGPLVETADGALLRFTYNGIEESSAYNNINTWGAEKAISLAFRSTDGGKTWSGPIELDRPTYGSVKFSSHAPRGTIPGAMDLTETTGIAIGNTVMALSRPIYSPWMWQCWSEDGGVTWDTAASATFPGYAQSMIKMSNGAIVCAHRYPGYAINVSWDDGLNWDAGTIIDWPTWAMGNVIEVEPDVLLVTYMNSDLGDVANLQKVPLLMQRVRIDRTGIHPAE
jgi:hypothetical protein